jgi:hypothetical protein
MDHGYACTDAWAPLPKSAAFPSVKNTWQNLKYTWQRPKKSSTNYTFVMVFLPNTFYRALDKNLICRVSDGTRQRKIAVMALGNDNWVCAECHRMTLDKGSLFTECPLYWHSAKKLLVSSFTKTFAERIRWNSAKGSPGGPLSVPLPNAFVGTRQMLLLCRVSRPQHSAKKLYRCPGVSFLPSCRTLTLG